MVGAGLPLAEEPYSPAYQGQCRWQRQRPIIALAITAATSAVIAEWPEMATKTSHTEKLLSRIVRATPGRLRKNAVVLPPPRTADRQLAALSQAL